jgi:hypothetical protein
MIERVEVSVVDEHGESTIATYYPAPGSSSLDNVKSSAQGAANALAEAGHSVAVHVVYCWSLWRLAIRFRRLLLRVARNG